jgi:hypothetical protein
MIVLIITLILLNYFYLFLSLPLTHWNFKDQAFLHLYYNNNHRLLLLTTRRQMHQVHFDSEHCSIMMLRSIVSSKSSTCNIARSIEASVRMECVRINFSVKSHSWEHVQELRGCTKHYTT